MVVESLRSSASRAAADFSSFANLPKVKLGQDLEPIKKNLHAISKRGALLSREDFSEADFAGFKNVDANRSKLLSYLGFGVLAMFTAFQGVNLVKKLFWRI